MTAHDSSRRAGVVCALESELTHLRAALPAADLERTAGRSFLRTELPGLPVVLGICGIGMLSAAAVTEALVARYAPTVVLNYGCAGSHRADLLPGDIVIGERVVAYDSRHESPEGTSDYAKMHYLRGEEMREVEFLAAAPALVEHALREGASLEGRHEPWPLQAGWPSGVAHRGPRVRVGTVASADRWNRAPGTIASLVTRHGSWCEDMEAAAIALTCASHDIDFLAIKDISNNELLRSTASGKSLVTEVGAGQLGRRAMPLILGVLRRLAAHE